MKGASMIIMVLLIVLAIPLFAVPVQGNTGTDFILAISNVELFTLNQNSQEVSFSDQELIDSNVPVLSVGLNKEHPINYIVMATGGSISYNNNVSQNYTNKNTIHGGVKRTNLRKH